MLDQRRLSLAFGVAGVVGVSATIAVVQLSRLLFSILRSSYNETLRTMHSVAAKINSDSPDEVLPEELYLVDEEEGVYTCGELQELYFRRNPDGPTDWQWSYDALAWYDTDDLAQDETAMLLDPPSLIFIMRLQLISVARRKIAAAGGLAAAAAGQAARGPHAGKQHNSRPRIPPPLQLPAWAEQELAQLQGGATCSSVRARGSGRQLLDAPDVLCCPITGQVMLQPVVTPCGRTFEYDALRRWITQHGRDPHSNQPLGLNQLYPNLLVRDMVERWLQTGSAVDGGPNSADRGHSLQLGRQLADPSDDPLSSFGASSSSSSSGGSDTEPWS